MADIIDPYRTGLAGRIEIINRVTVPLPRVFVDRTLVARSLSNIVENALHAMPGQGRLTIDAAADDQFVTLRIEDDGIGMDEEALARVFEPYFSTKTTGTGLGLPIARRNIELNGGAIDVVSGKGQGTTVTVRLPIAILGVRQMLYWHCSPSRCITISRRRNGRNGSLLVQIRVDHSPDSMFQERHVEVD